MYQVKKTFEIAVAHMLNLPYTSPCNRFHGHNLLVTVYCRASDEEVAENNRMVIDFSTIKEIVHGQLDHRVLNDVLFEGDEEAQPTSENLARWIYEKVPHCYRVDVQESSGNTASYIED